MLFSRPQKTRFFNDSFLFFYPVDGSKSYKTKISFNLLDSLQSDYIDYFEIHVNSKEDVKILFYKEENETSNLLYKLEKPDLKFEWLINSETGETKIY